METLIFLIRDYGYLFVFIATVLEGETVLALAGFVAFQGYLSLPWVIFTAFLGGMLGDQIFFYFGRWRGKQFIEARPKLLERSKSAYDLIARHRNLLIFGSRFIYGFRTIIPIVLGTSTVSGVRFLVFNILGAAVWSTIFGMGGYLLGSAVETYIANIHKAEKFVILGVILGAFIVQAVNFISKRIEQSTLRRGGVGDKTRDNSTGDV